MKLKRIEGLTIQDLQNELDRGGRFIMFNYSFSILVMTFKRGSSVYFIRGNESHLPHQWKHTIFTLFAGWWGIPWGPIYTIQSLFKNLTGGIDVTDDIVSSLISYADQENESADADRT